MLEQVVDNLKKATETTLNVQKEMFEKWVALWPGTPAVGNKLPEQAQQAQKRWVEFVSDLVQKQKEVLEKQFQAGIKNLENFKLTEVKGPEQFQAQTMELWKKSFDCLRQAYEAQMGVVLAAAGKWSEMLLKSQA